jgi:replicative DNA helicase
MAQILSAATTDQLLEPYKTPPHSVEAEQSVLGGLMLDNHAWDKVADVITADDFYRQDHRLIYRHICKLVEQSKPADVVTVAESLEISAELQNVGGLAYVGVMVQNTPSAANIRRYAEIVRERSIMRRLARVGAEITDSAYSPSGRSASSLLDEAEAKVFEIAEVGA